MKRTKRKLHRKIVGGIVVGALAAEVLPGSERGQPHTHVEQQEQPQPVGHLTQIVASTSAASSTLSFGNSLWRFR